MRPLLSSLAVLLLVAASPTQEGELPKAVRGFSGQVLGAVAARHDDGSFSLRVVQVTRVWKGNEATDLEWFVGRKLRVEPRWAKGEDGKWHPVARHARFIAGLRDRQDLRLEIKHAERDRFAILELSAMQRRAAGEGDGGRRLNGDRARDGEGDARAPHDRDRELPADLRGFSGRVGGIVRGRNDDGTIRFEVLKVFDVWQNSQAKQPQALVGHTVRVTPQWVKGEDGRWHPQPEHVAFLKRLKVGEDYRIELINEELTHFRILELSAEQRKWARQRELK